MLKDCPATVTEYYGAQVPLFTIDASNLVVGEAIYVDGTDAAAPEGADPGTPLLKFLVPAETTTAYDATGAASVTTVSTSPGLQTDGDVKSFTVGVGTTMNVKPCGLIVRTSETVIYFAPTSGDTE